MNLVEWSMYALPAYFSGFLILLFLHKFYIDPKKEPQFALLGMLLGQAASVIYTVSLIKFIIRKKLTYVVTPKDSNSAQRVSWNVFAFHILILLATILTLEISFITEHDSIVMRFWAVVNVIFLTLILITAYWGSFISMFKWRVKESPLYPLVTDLNYDKYGYVIKNPNKVRILYGLGILAWASTLYGFTQFLSLNPWYWLFFGPVLGIISIHNFLNYGINTFYKKFDIAKHEKLKEEYWQTNRVNLPSVDVFLPVCGEKINILRDTFSSVKRLDYLNMQAYVLDDKGDSEVEVLAKEFGFIYLSRPNKGEMKKAGNLMYGFKHGTGEFYAVFDADFCPHPDFINDLLPYMADEKVGLVQSPHFFEIGNHIHKRAPIEYGSANLQEQFFRTIQVARDRFGGAICAGSNTIYRRSALEKNGGPAQVDHGEDVNTGIDIINLGYKIKYVPVILAKGLSPDTLQSFYKQQNRWASSSTGLLLSGKIFKAKLTFAQKLCYLSGITYYMSQVAYFLLPLQLFLMLGLHADSISVERAAPFIPYMIFSMIILPLFSRKSKPKFGTYLAVMSSVYVHVYTIILRLFGQHAQWVPTNAITSKIERGFLFLNDFSLLFLAAYFFGISLLIYNWNLPLLNGVYLSLMFWMAWNISMHFMYFFQTHRVIHFQKAVEAATHPLLKRDFNFWRVKSYAGLAVIFLSVTSSSVYTLQATGNQVFFAPRSEILAMINKEEITNNLAMINSMVDENTGVLGVAKAEEASDDKLYIEEVLPGDSLTRVYRRIINSFVRDTEVSLSPKEKLVLENYLVVNLPKLKIRQGDVIQVYQSQLADALLIILK